METRPKSPLKTQKGDDHVLVESSSIGSSPYADLSSIDQDESPRNAFTPKRVVTPDWVKEEVHFDHKETKKKSVDNEKIADLHFELEVIERRIEYCIDQKHGHPALCVQVREEEGTGEITRKEKKMRVNYKFVPPVNVVPAFWVPRVYDKKENKLSIEESELLKVKINESRNQSGSTQIVTRIHSWGNSNPVFSYTEDDKSEYDYDSNDDDPFEDDEDYERARMKAMKKASQKKHKQQQQPAPVFDINGMPKRRRGRPRKNPLGSSLFSISLVSFATDDSEQDTDWDDNML